jgi:hypothetical protein
MKTLRLFLPFFLIILYSCKKSNSGNNGSTPSYYLASVVNYGTQQKIVDSFYYDSLNRIDTFTQYIYDTTSGTPKFNTWTAQFIYDGTNTYPSYYNLYDPLLGNYGDYHLLSYDPDVRIIKDTSLSGSGYVVNYSYPGSNITYEIEFEGTAQDNLIDSFYLAKGNISSEASYLSNIPGQPDQLQYSVQNIYASIANPGYHEAMTNSIGPLLTTIEQNSDGGFIDFISKNALDHLSGIENVAQSVSLDYDLQTDNKGRLSQMTSSLGAGIYLLKYYYY